MKLYLKGTFVIVAVSFINVDNFEEDKLRSCDQQSIFIDNILSFHFINIYLNGLQLILA